MLWIIRNRAGEPNDHEVVLCNASNREEAKRIAFHYLFGNLDKYTVEPITRHGERVFIRIAKYRWIYLEWVEDE